MNWTNDGGVGLTIGGSGPIRDEDLGNNGKL